MPFAVTIATTQGPKEVPGAIRQGKYLAIQPSGPEGFERIAWTITHIPTGKGVFRLTHGTRLGEPDGRQGRKMNAQSLAARMAKALGRMADWDFVTAEPPAETTRIARRYLLKMRDRGII
jgi:hypothetical protein